MKQLVIMPGGFHPFHAGHYALYQSAKQAFPGADIKVAATNDTSQRPFPFKIKEKLAQVAGVSPANFYQVKSPFRAEEITKNYNPDDTELIFVRSEKDANKPPQAGGVKKNGEPAYLQLWSGQQSLEPMSQHAYMAYLPTVEFGPGMTSATEIRTAWPTLTDRRKTALVMSLYPKTQTNSKLAATVVKMLDAAIGGEELNEFATGGGGGSGDYLRSLASAWYNGVFDTGSLPRGIKTQEDVERLLNRGIVCPDGKTRKLHIDYNSDFDGVEIYSDDYYEHGDLDGNDGRTGQPWGPYDHMEFRDEELDESLNEFAPDDGDESRKFIPWNEFVDQLKQILHKDFDCKESINTDVIKAKFVPYDPMELGPTQIYSYFERRMGRDKGANSVRGQIQVGKFMKGQSGLMTGYHLLKGTEFERYFDLTFENLYKIANIIKGNTQGRLEAKQQGVAEGRQPALEQLISKLGERKKSNDYIEEKWSKKYKRSIDCSNPKGFSQRAHCRGRKK